MNIQPLIQHTMLHDAVALPRRHRACAQAVPGGLDVPLDPFLDGGDVGGCVLQVFADVLDLGGADHGGLRGAARLGLNGPAAMLDPSGDVVRAAVSLGVLEVKVLGCGRAVKSVEADVPLSISEIR